MGCEVSFAAIDDCAMADLMVFDAVSFEGLDTRQCHALPPCIVIDGKDEAAAGIAAVRRGALEYLVAQSGEAEKIGSIFEWHQHFTSGRVQAVSLASERLISQATRVAKTDVAVLLSGESGTGKEVMARLIHSRSTRRAKPFVSINCAAIPDNMLEAMLFGHEKGAFTGATESRPGKFELAEGGTLLLDELTEMPLALQAKLLRVLQEREVERIGARTPRSVDVRVIATTNRDLKDALKAGHIREDLYYRLNVFPLVVPPLRTRAEEIPGLVMHFLQKHRRLVAPREVRTIAPEVFDLFLRYSWPGNVRELENVIQRALVLCDGAVIGTSHVDLGMASIDSRTGELSRRLLLAEGETIVAALRDRRGHRAQTAEALGISERTLRYKLKRLKDLGMEVI